MRKRRASFRKKRQQFPIGWLAGLFAVDPELCLPERLTGRQRDAPVPAWQLRKAERGGLQSKFKAIFSNRDPRDDRANGGPGIVRPRQSRPENLGDDTTVPVMAKGKTDTGRLWNYVRDDRPFGGADPPAVVFRYSRDRRGEHPQAHLSTWIKLWRGEHNFNNREVSIM